VASEQTLDENAQREARKAQADRQLATFAVIILFVILVWLAWLKGQDS
jgi:hypothetical protein